MSLLEKKTNFAVLGRKENLLDQRRVDFKSRLFLFFSVLVLFVSFLLVFSDNLGIIYPEKSLGDKANPVTWMIFSTGLLINLFCVPFLYLSSYLKFKKSDDFWDMEVFWILPLSFFGTFFQYISDLPYTLVSIPFSLTLVLIVHVRMMVASKKLITMDEQYDNTSGYFRSFTYLTVYYVMLAAVVVFFDLFEKIDYWIS